MRLRTFFGITRTARVAVGILLLMGSTGCAPATSQDAAAPIAFAIHGGAGTITRGSMTPETEAAYRAKLEEALRAGYGVLEGGGASLDAVVAAIRIMEESDLFNAGKGAVFTSEGTVELDASIMDGGTRAAGAVAGVTRVRSPIELARLVMERSPHVMMVGAGAEAFGAEQGVEMVENAFFHTERRRRQLERVQQEAGTTGAALDSVRDPLLSPGADRVGTVGAVALDRSGNLAAGTSTGGMTNKQFGRVGDSPIIGAGTYADNATCAVSATGHGEYFIRGVIAHDIAARMAYGGATLAGAADAVIMDDLTARGGTGGVIAVDRDGRVAMPFNTEGMYRAAIDASGTTTIEIYREE